MNGIIQEAARQARAVLAKTGLDSLPIPVDRVAKNLGIVVQHLPLDDELSGMSFVKDGLSVIVINAGHHPNRQRFTLAHELGHHILHREYLLNNVHVDKVVLHRNNRSSDGVDNKEIQANAFAAELLMPMSKVRQHKDIDINDESEVATVAKLFKVSSSAMAIRINNIS
ncbi:MAG: ImmA/IrrE family metallo-endopeptidase [Alphaproteobacteria bacterium]|nr:ImmA/IrrE family metallo-endopeptidase [Alphaproteobacteria bacterium]